MPDTYAIAALRKKRARIAGEIGQAEGRLAKHRETLATLDAVIRMFESAGNPEPIPAIRPLLKCLYFEHGEHARLCYAALREAGKPVMVQWVADYAIAAKGLEVDARVRARIVRQTYGALTRLARRGKLRKIIDWPDAWWELAG